MDVSVSELRELVMTGRPGVLRLMGLQRVRHDWATELNWTDAEGRMEGKQNKDSENYIIDIFGKNLTFSSEFA